MVKMGIPVEAPEGMSSEVSDHFGMAQDFAVFEYSGGEVTELQFIHNSPRAPESRNNARLLADEGVKIVLAGSMGPHMISLLLAEGMRVFKDAEGTIEEVLEDYRAGMLAEARSAGTMI
jgi:predicted Fe-Mo cluster-binding NifX family protein